MTRDVIRLTIADLSDFTKSLRGDWPDAPGHVDMLNIVARAAGYRNFQHLRSENAPIPKVDQRKVDRALRNFDDMGRFANWPAKTNMQRLCLWGVWAQVAARTAMNEREISVFLDENTSLKDAAQLRRSLVEMGLLTRTKDGSWSCHVYVPAPQLIYAAFRSNAKGL